MKFVSSFADRYDNEKEIDSEIDRQIKTDRFTPFVEAPPGVPTHGLVKLPNPFHRQLHFSRFRNTPTDILHGLSGGCVPAVRNLFSLLIAAFSVGEKLLQIFLKHLHSKGGDTRVDEFDRWVAWV